MRTRKIMFLVLALFLASCQKEDNDLIIPSIDLPTSYLSGFQFLKSVNPQLTQDLIGQVSDRRISMQVPGGLAFTNLVASFTTPPETKVYLNNTEQVSGKTENDFSHPVMYKV